VRIRFEEQA